MFVRYGVGLLIMGILLYLSMWLRHDAGGFPGLDKRGEWNGAPAWFRRIVRRDSGPVLLVSTLIELTALAVSTRGLVTIAGLPADPFDLLAGTAVNVGILLIGVAWAWLYLRSRLR